MFVPYKNTIAFGSSAKEAREGLLDVCGHGGIALQLCGFLCVRSVERFVSVSKTFKVLLAQTSITLYQSSMALYPSDCMHRQLLPEAWHPEAIVLTKIVFDGFIPRNLPFKFYSNEDVVQINTSASERVRFEPFQFFPDNISSDSESEQTNGFWVSYEESHKCALLLWGCLITSPKRTHNSCRNYRIWDQEGVQHLVHAEVRPFEWEYNEQIERSKPEDQLFRVIADRLNHISLFVTKSHLQKLQAQGHEFYERPPHVAWYDTRRGRFPVSLLLGDVFEALQEGETADVVESPSSSNEHDAI